MPHNRVEVKSKDALSEVIVSYLQLKSVELPQEDHEKKYSMKLSSLRTTTVRDQADISQSRQQ